MLYLPVSAREASRAWVYELIFVSVTFLTYRTFLSELPVVNEFIPADASQFFSRTQIFILVFADICVFLVDLWNYSIRPWLTGVPRPVLEWPWWAWCWTMEDPEEEPFRMAVGIDGILALLAAGGMDLIRKISTEGGPPSIAEIELTYFLSFVVVRVTLSVIVPHAIFLLVFTYLIILELWILLSDNPILRGMFLLFLSVFALYMYRV